MRTRTKGIQITKDGNRIAEKQYKGQRIFARLGQVSQDEAEQWLRAQQAAIDAKYAEPARYDFATAAARFLKEQGRKNLKDMDGMIYHVNLASEWIGNLPLEAIHIGALQDFIEYREDVDEVKPTTINRTLTYINSVLIRASRVWRDDNGKSWLSVAPLIEKLDEIPRQPYPITWDEQKRLFAELPAHLEKMALFAINTGLRSANVYGLRWEWERRIKELNRSVFVIPAELYKTGKPHVVILNDVASSIIESCRGKHRDSVFTYKKHEGAMPIPVKSMNNTGWQNARERVGLHGLRVHDLRHTFAHRLRDAGVSTEDRSVLMGHATTTMAEHYATPTIAKLIETANLVNGTRDSMTILRLVNSHAESHAQRKAA